MSAQITSLRSDYPPPGLLIRLIAGCLPPVINASRHHSSPCPHPYPYHSPCPALRPPAPPAAPRRPRPCRLRGWPTPARPGPVNAPPSGPACPAPAASSGAPGHSGGGRPSPPPHGPGSLARPCSLHGGNGSVPGSVGISGRMLPVSSWLKYRRVNRGWYKTRHSWMRGTALSGALYPVLGSSVREGQGATGEGPAEGNQDDEGSGMLQGETARTGPVWLWKAERESHNPYKYY